MLRPELMIEQPASNGTNAPDLALPQPGPGVLLVDDDPTVRNLVSRLLTVKGYRVFPASCSSDALAFWEEHESEIELLLTDMIMPGGLSGHELACRCQEKSARLKVIFTSGYNLELSTMDGSLKEGFNFLQKPYRPEQLFEVVQRMLAGTPNPRKKTYVANPSR